MTGLAIGRESRSRVARIGGRQIIVIVARDAIHRRAGVSAGMALDTRHGEVGAGQLELRQVVVEVGGLPTVGCMALRAVVAESALHVVGIGDIIVIRHMAGIAVGRRSGIPAAVALDARRRGMRAGQREGGLVVIEDR